MKNIIVTLEVNQTGNKLTDPFDDVCRKARFRYVDKIGCDYFSIKEKKHEILFWNKFQVYDIAQTKDYDKVLFMDADVLITPNCPNVFDTIDSGIGVVMDGWNRNYRGFEVKKREEMDINAGFLLACRDSFNFFIDNSIEEDINPLNWDTPGGISEQTYFRNKIKQTNIKYTQLPELWNYQPWYNDYAKDWEEVRNIRKNSGVTRKDAYMIHYTLLKKLMKYDYAYFYENSGYLPLFEDIDKIP